MARFRIAASLRCPWVLAPLLLLLGTLGACGTPCGNLWKKVERCGPSGPSDKAHRDISSEARHAFARICKKADKSRVKSCIKLRDCKKLLRCAGGITK